MEQRRSREKKKKIADACEGADSSTAASTSSGTSRSSRTSMRRSHLHSLRSQEWFSVPAACMGYYEKVANYGRRYPQLAESRHADAEKMRVTVKTRGLAKLQPYKHRRWKRQCTSSASDCAICIDLLRRETLSGPARCRRLRYGRIDGFFEPCWPSEAVFW